MLFKTIAVVVALFLFSAGLFAAEIASGEPVAEFTLQDYRGKEVSLSDFANSRLVVLAFLGTECPLAKLYAGRLQEIAEHFEPDNVAIIGLNANVQDSMTEIGAFMRRHELSYPMLKDLGNRVADAVGAQRTPEVILLDEHRSIRYRGRIDDQYMVGIVRSAPQREDLKIAIEELLTGKPVSVPKTEPLGCLIGRVREANEDCEVTYSNQIARLFQKHCVSCHREGEIAPFTLTSYEDVVGWGEMIAEVIRERRMPPWHADPQYGEFANNCSLSEEQKELVEKWVRNGCPEGDPNDLPEPLTFTEGWQLPREPDLVIDMRDEPFEVPAEAGKKGVKYQNFWVDPQLTEDKWVLGAEVRPGNRSVVHHIIVYAHLDGYKGKRSSFLTAYVPGLRLDTPMPEGAAKKLTAGSWLRFQVHYTPIGTPQKDLSSVGLIFADPATITHEVRTTEVVETGLEIKPHLPHQQFSAKSRPSPIDVQLLSLSPHMHLRGKSFRYEVEYPDGRRETLLNVPEYDFNWQTRYCLEKPLPLPAGTRMHCTAVYDNSPSNLANPDPSETVRWGDQSWDEMMIGYMDVLFPINAIDSSEKLFGRWALSERVDVDAAIRWMDQDSDGKLTRDEIQKVKLLYKGFDRIDTDADGLVTREELNAALEKYGLPQ